MMSTTHQETSRIIERHLSRFQPTALSTTPMQSRSSLTGTPDLADVGQASAAVDDPASVESLRQGLWELLGHYVALLESSDHGGWSRDDDETVRHILSLLGWTNVHV